MRNSVGGPGSYSAICDVCGLKYKASELMKRWDGAMVCKWDYETRHPQEFVRAKRDNPVLPFIRPDSTDGIDVGPTYACSTFDVETYLNSFFQDILESYANTTIPGSFTIYKVRTYGGTVHIPDGVILHVKCSLEIGL